jgi:peptidoglycan/xylan/chitin deacetylase (PgdA/CDA1 family)
MPSRSLKPVALVVVSLVPLSAISGFGCKKGTEDAAAAKPAPAPVKKGPEAPKIDYAAIRPNELGVIPVIMYHEVRGTKNDVRKLTRSLASFREDLEILHKNNFYPVNMGDVVSNNIDVPAGKSPVVLTFDDARTSQFKLLETPNALKIDPNTAMGIMDSFSKAHSDWPMRATFFVLPKSRSTEPFGQSGMSGDKFNYIVDNGMEIGNHSMFHKSFRHMTPAQIQTEIGSAHKAIMEMAPKAKIQVFALPMGQYPRDKANWKYLIKGTYQGTTYDYKAALDAAWQPAYPPSAKKYKPIRIQRIDSIDGLNGIRYWVKNISASGALMPRYISDGDPNVISYPKGNESEVNTALLKAQGKLLNPYSPFGKGGAKPIVGAEAPKQIIDPSKPDEGEKPIIAEYGDGAKPANTNSN